MEIEIKRKTRQVWKGPYKRTQIAALATSAAQRVNWKIGKICYTLWREREPQYQSAAIYAACSAAAAEETPQ